MIDLPTTRADWRLVARTVRLVVGTPVYAVVAAVTAVVTLTGLVVSQNLPLVVDVVIGGALPLRTRVDILLLQFPFVGPAFTSLQGTLVVAVAALVGVDVALLVYHLREHRVSLRGGSGSVVGVVLGALGAGCAACGPVVLAGVLSLLGAGGLLAALPLAGLELALASVALLALSLYWLADGMRGGQIRGCPVDPGS